MKKTTLALTALSTILTAFAARTLVTEKKSPTASARMGVRIVEALKDGSAEQYAALFPTLSEFDKIMEDRSGFYGDRLAEAQEAFAFDYLTNLIPQVKDSFEKLLRDGNNRGINWRTVRYVGIEIASQPGEQFGTAEVTVVVASGPKEYRIKLDRALVIEGQWKVSQFIKLI